VKIVRQLAMARRELSVDENAALVGKR